MSDLHAFARAIADRYSGRHAGYPFVGDYTVWNEPNSSRFVAPTFDAGGNPLAPSPFAAICRAVYEGLKAGNPLAAVAIGPTSGRRSRSPRPTRACRCSSGSPCGTSRRTRPGTAA